MMDDDDDIEYASPTLSATETDFEEAEEVVEEELTETSHTDEWLFEFLMHHEKDDHTTLDERAHQIFLDVRNKIKAGPKPPQMEADAEKVGVERQLEDNSKQLNALLEFGDTLLSNIKIVREASEQAKREEAEKRMAELQQRIKQEQIEANASYEMIKGRWLELNEIDEPLALFEQIEVEKHNIDALMESKAKLLAECQEEASRVNARFQAQQKEQNHDLDCLGSAVLHQFELISKCTKGHLEMLESTVDDEWKYISLCNKKKFELLSKATNTNEQRMNEIIKDKENLYAKELAHVQAKHEEITRLTRLRLEKECEQLEVELRQAHMEALMNSEKNDYNHQILLRRTGEDILLGNQQKRRISRLCENIQAAKNKLNKFLNQSKLKYQRIKANIEKLHQSITAVERKSRYSHRYNRLQFKKIWTMQFNELQSTLKQLLEIDRILYEQQLAQPWPPIEIDFSDFYDMEHEEHEPGNDDSSIHLDSQIKLQEKRQQKRKEQQMETRFLRNVLRQISLRSQILFDSKLLKALERYTEEDVFVVSLHSVFNILNIRDMETVHEMLEYYKPYAWCPNCQTAPRKVIIDRLYAEGYGKSTSSTSTQARPTPKREVEECDDHHLVIEPMLVLSALKEFVRKHSMKRFSYVTFPYQSSKSVVSQMALSVEAIERYWSKFNDCIPDERIKVWRLLKHGLNHFMITLEDRVRLDAECMKLSRQNWELRYFMGDQDQNTLKQIEEVAAEKRLQAEQEKQAAEQMDEEEETSVTNRKRLPDLHTTESDDEMPKSRRCKPILKRRQPPPKPKKLDSSSTVSSTCSFLSGFTLSYESRLREPSTITSYTPPTPHTPPTQSSQQELQKQEQKEAEQNIELSFSSALLVTPMPSILRMPSPKSDFKRESRKSEKKDDSDKRDSHRITILKNKERESHRITISKSIEQLDKTGSHRSLVSAKDLFKQESKRSLASRKSERIPFDKNRDSKKSMAKVRFL